MIKGDFALLESYEDLAVKLIVYTTATDGMNTDEKDLISKARQFVQACQNRVQPMLERVHSDSTTDHRVSEPVAQADILLPPIASKTAQTSQTTSPETVLREAVDELNSMIGLGEVKAEVKRLMNFLTVQQERKKHGLKGGSQSLHFVFTGNPGTGKTTVARILGKVFYGFGVLKPKRSSNATVPPWLEAT